MGMRALSAGSAVLIVGVVACSSARAATASPAAAAAGGQAKAATSSAAAAKASAAAATSAAATKKASAAAATVTRGPVHRARRHRALAARLSAGIQDALRGRAGHHAVTVYDTVTEVSCYTGSDRTSTRPAS